MDIAVGTLPRLDEAGFTGGRDNLKAFCRRIFADRSVPFLRSDRDDLVVFRHEHLRAFGASGDIGNVPPGVMYPAVFPQTKPGARPPNATVAEVVSNQVFTMNDPLHGAARRILTNWLGPRAIGEMEVAARECAIEVLAAVPLQTAVDFVQAVAEPFTTLFWARILRFTDAEASTVLKCAQTMTKLFHIDRTPEDVVALDNAFIRYRDAIDAAARRNLASHEALVQSLADQLAAIDLADDVHAHGIVPKTIGAFLAGNLIDAFHTAALASANVAHVLLHQPNAFAQVLASPELLLAAVVEALRLEPPVIMLKRYALRDTTIAGVRVPQGMQIGMLWAAGNLDPTAFPEPERFDIARRHQGLTTFGGGAHICPGRHAAVMLSRILFETIIQSGYRLERAETAPRWYDRHLMCQIESLPVIIRRDGQHACQKP